MTIEKNEAAGGASRSDAGLGERIRDCSNCKHMIGNDPEWQECNRPNYPQGKNWNRLTSTQRYVPTGNTCYGRYWEPNA